MIQQIKNKAAWTNTKRERMCLGAFAYCTIACKIIHSLHLLFYLALDYLLNEVLFVEILVWIIFSFFSRAVLEFAFFRSFQSLCISHLIRTLSLFFFVYVCVCVCVSECCFNSFIRCNLSVVVRLVVYGLNSKASSYYAIIPWVGNKFKRLLQTFKRHAAISPMMNTKLHSKKASPSTSMHTRIYSFIVFRSLFVWTVHTKNRAESLSTIARQRNLCAMDEQKTPALSHVHEFIKWGNTIHFFSFANKHPLLQ